MYRRLAVGLLALLFAAALPIQVGATAAGPQARVVSIAEAQLGKRFRMGSEGPTRFDCSGLVYYVFTRAGLHERFGPKRLLARQYYKWGRERGLLSKKNPQVGDLIVWTEKRSPRIQHIGIYVGEDARGKGRAISALYTGVRRHDVKIGLPLLAYVHTGLGTDGPAPTPTPSVTPSVTPSPPPSASSSPT